jgi:hypothetical protein
VPLLPMRKRLFAFVSLNQSTFRAFSPTIHNENRQQTDAEMRRVSP